MLPPAIDATHDPALQSWVPSAAPGRTHFPIQNLPFGVFSPDDGANPRIGVRIGDEVLDMRALDRAWLYPEPNVNEALGAPTLNALMALPAGDRGRLRAQLSTFLRAGGADEAARRSAAERAMVPAAAVEMRLPVQIGGFVDFYACMNHAVTAGTVLRRGEPAPLPSNWKWMPLGYHGRAASVQAGGVPVWRPMGQRRPDRAEPPRFGLTAELDYEAELGAFVGPGCAAGCQVPIAAAAQHIFGYVLVNDWSARDIQTWEGGPLGPFLSKSFATSISSWIVTSEALAPFRIAAHVRSDDDPRPLPHLDDAYDRAWGGLNVQITASLRTAQMCADGRAAQLVSSANAHELYWTMQQMIVHAASNGSGLGAGDLLASGTISGDADGTRGCLLETTRRGRLPLKVGDETRGFLEDGDEVILSGYCEQEGYVPIGFGECTTLVLPGRTAP